MLRAKKSTKHLRNDTDDIPDQAYERICRILKTLGGFQLHGYKNACIKRRISARIRSAGYASAMEYADFLLQSRSEPARLIKMLTIHVSKFFRNRDTFNKLRDEIFPGLFDSCLRKGRNHLNIQSIGCASGEEPYSLALILHNSFAREMSQVNVSIRATDIDAEVLRVAAEAAYEVDRLDEAPAAITKRYFTYQDDKYRLVPEIRNMVTFHCQDMLRPEPLEECDLILCRNVLIYLERSHQEALLKRFAESLRAGGILVLGKTENLMGEVRELYQTLCPVERIYRKK
ncbi:MAG: protein-glutamate O-methyltransferase CheR [Deltaproteobacteria bacterium]|nr:protein-glutamate O-methyltransferase CheR [Deltaproteobacteria bacterium]TLN03434.1 MAG: protein-glutamate O-methyltransferase CheR [bacterium]